MKCLPVDCGWTVGRKTRRSGRKEEQHIVFFCGLKPEALSFSFKFLSLKYTYYEILKKYIIFLHFYITEQTTESAYK